MSLVPYDDRDGFIWMDGTMVPWRGAKVHVLTHALHYASCVFEGERVYDGRIFKLTEHTRRLAHSARTLGFELPYDLATIDQACKQVVAANGIGGRLRAAAGLARPRDDGRIRAALPDPGRDRGLDLAGLLHARGAPQGHPHDPRRSTTGRRRTPRRPRARPPACT